MPRRRFAMARAAPRARRAKWAWGGCRRSSCGGGACACPAVPGEQIEKLAPRLRTVGEVVRLVTLAVGEPLARVLFTDTAPPEIHTLALHDALLIAPAKKA